MTTDEAFDYIEANSKPGDWFFSHGAIRHKKPIGFPYGNCPCPVCWMASQLGVNPEGHWADVMKVLPGLKMSDGCGFDMAFAADSRGGNLRARMLKACHLEEIA